MDVFSIFYKIMVCCVYSFELPRGLTTCQPLWVILCCLPEKGRKDIEEIVEEMKETGSGKKEELEWKWRNRRNKNIPPLLLPAKRIAGLAQLEANISWTPQWYKIPVAFATPNHPQNCLDESILMSTHNIHFRDETGIPKYLFSWAVGRIS